MCPYAAQRKNKNHMYFNTWRLCSLGFGFIATVLSCHCSLQKWRAWARDMSCICHAQQQTSWGQNEIDQPPIWWLFFAPFQPQQPSPPARNMISDLPHTGRHTQTDVCVYFRSAFQNRGKWGKILVLAMCDMIKTAHILYLSLRSMFNSLLYPSHKVLWPDISWETRCGQPQKFLTILVTVWDESTQIKNCSTSWSHARNHSQEARFPLVDCFAAHFRSPSLAHASSRGVRRNWNGIPPASKPTAKRPPNWFLGAICLVHHITS